MRSPALVLPSRHHPSSFGLVTPWSPRSGEVQSRRSINLCDHMPCALPNKAWVSNPPEGGVSAMTMPGPAREAGFEKCYLLLYEKRLLN